MRLILLNIFKKLLEYFRNINYFYFKCCLIRVDVTSKSDTLLGVLVYLYSSILHSYKGTEFFVSANLNGQSVNKNSYCMWNDQCYNYDGIIRL